MTYLDRLFARATARRAEPASKAAPPGRLRVASGAPSWAAPSAEGDERQARLYTHLSWIQIAADTKANYVATTPLQVYRRAAAGRQGVVNHPLELRMDRPNLDMSRFEFLHDTSCWLDITGECYWWRNRAGPEAPDDEIWIQPTTAMTPIPDGAGGFAGFWYDPGDGQRIRLEPWEVVYFRTFNPLSRYRGLSAVQALALGAQADIAAQRTNLSYYDKDAAKPGGILAFADDIEEGAWRRLDQDIKDQTAGAKSARIMKLRNVGSGGVQWIMTHIPQREQQFLEGRTFTKEEIFARIAPGLSSILAVNATEANATAGLNTFLGMAVFPRTVAIAQKVSTTMLAEDEIAEFDDVRQVDTETEIKAQQQYAATHTVDEVRQRFYGDPPIGDERGRLLVAAAQGWKPPTAEPEPAMVTPEALAEAGKRLDRRRWRDKAIKALAAGRVADVPFTPEYLSDDEAMQVRAALRRGDVAGAFGGEG